MAKKEKEERDGEEIENLNDVVDSHKDVSELYNFMDSLMTSDENLNFKTEINNPKEMALLEAYIELLKDVGFTSSAKMLEDWGKGVKEMMVSFERGGRLEMCRVMEKQKDKMEDELLAE